MLFRTIVNSTKLLFLYLLIQPPSPKIKIPQNSNVNDLKINFQETLLDPIYDAIVAKGITPNSKSLMDIVNGINNIPTGNESPVVNKTYSSFGGAIEFLSPQSSDTDVLLYIIRNHNNVPSTPSANFYVGDTNIGSKTFSAGDVSFYWTGKVPKGQSLKAIFSGSSFGGTGICFGK